LTISTSLEVASSATSLAIAQGQVQSVSMTMGAVDLFATKITTSVTGFSFTTQSDLVIGTKITIKLPA
jgi:hypothetical protein